MKDARSEAWPRYGRWWRHAAPALGARWALSACASGLTGCALTSASLSHSQAPQFDCESARLAQAPSGYRLEGCGKMAFYHCTRVRQGRSVPSPHRPAVYWTPHGPPRALSFRAAREGVDQQTTPSECRLESERAMSIEEQAAESARLTPTAEVSAAMRSAPGATTLARARFRGGSIALLAPAAELSEHMLMSVHANEAVELDDGCRLSGFVDATPLTIGAVRQTTPHDLQLIVRSGEMRGLENSTRFFGTVCGVRFDLDDGARRTLGKFELARRESR